MFKNKLHNASFRKNPLKGKIHLLTAVSNFSKVHQPTDSPNPLRLRKVSNYFAKRDLIR